MTETTLQAALHDLPLGGLRSYKTIGSTNDEALAWAASGAPDLCLIYSDEQTAGRGRMGRTWFTPAGTALAFSLILRPRGVEKENVGLFSGLGALALVATLKKHGVTAQIKWPNDVLINRRKAAGILVETVWIGTDVDSVVLGMGVNVHADSVPPPEVLNFPATCILSEVATPVERFDLLYDLLSELIAWRSALGSDEFTHAWEESLAFRGETVEVRIGLGADSETIVGRVAGLEPDGSLRLSLSGGETRGVRFGEVHLRPL